ncbi:MAG: InlB B-repeat-containing protein [Lachnospiraceae bacterium]
MAEWNNRSSLEITQTGTYAADWNTIYEAYKTEIEREHGKIINKSDIESIKLKPYKISKNNSTNPDKHVDCTVEIKVKDAYTANYWLWNAGQTGYEYAEARSYYKNEQTSPTASRYPTTKTVNGVTYTFLGWYDNEALSGEAVTFPYTITDHNVNFYAKYVAGYYVDYDLNGGNWASAQTKWFKNVGSTVVVVATEPTKTGYDFAGWTYSEDGSKTYHAGDSFVMPEKNVKLTAKWTPQQKSYTVNYLLNGTSEKVQDPDTKTGTWGTKVTENAPDISGYTHVATDPATKIHTVGTGTDEINFYYYKNVTLQADSATYTYDGTEKSVSGYTRTDTNTGVTITGVTAGASGTDAAEYPATFTGNPVGKLINDQYCYRGITWQINDHSKYGTDHSNDRR